MGEIKITESSNPESSWISGRRISNNYILIITDRQTPGVEYIIEITDIEDEDEMCRIIYMKLLWAILQA